MTFDEFKQKQYYPFPTLGEWEDMPVGLSQFHDDPEGHPLTTPSGKLEYYSTALADIFPDDEIRSPVPKWVEEGDGHEERIDSGSCARVPLPHRIEPSAMARPRELRRHHLAARDRDVQGIRAPTDTATSRFGSIPSTLESSA